MACFCAAGIAHFCQLPQLPPRRQCPLPFFCKWPRLARHRAARYQKLSNPPLPLFARSANCTRFLRLIFFRHKSAVSQNCTHFCIFHLFAKISTFLRAAILRAFLAFLFLRLPFQKTVPLLRVPKIRLYFNHTKRGGIFHFKPPKQHLKLKFIFLKSTQNLWKGFWENLTMCHILPHFAGKQCAFFN